jgi:hypothetical protein
MTRRRILLVLVGLLFLSGVLWLLMGRETGVEDTETQAMARPNPAHSFSGTRGQIEGGGTRAGTVQATVTDASTSDDPLDTQVHSGPRLYQLVVEAIIANRRNAVLGTSTESAGRSGQVLGARRPVLSQAAGDAPWELLVATWVLVGAAWILRGAGRRPAVRK